MRPAESTLEAVHAWLDEHAIPFTARTHNKAMDWITINLPVERVESLLRTKYSLYRHEDGTHLVRTPSWSLPEHLHHMIETIQPTNSFFRPRSDKSTMKPVEGLEAFLQAPQLQQDFASAGDPVAKVCNTSAVTPTCLRTLYGTIDYKPQVPGTSKVGLCNYLNETNNRSDTSIFLQRYRPDAVSAANTFKTVQINNGDIHQTPNTPAQFAAGQGIEGNLDVETILGFDYPIPLTAYNTGGMPPYVPDVNEPTDTNEPYLDWINYVLAQSASDVPQVISTSYGDDEQTVPQSYAKKVCAQFAALGARGTTLLFSSGDNGVGSNGTCVSNDGKNTTRFIPSFPATCPYITAVGATKNFEPEVVAYDPSNGFASGGGFSNYFATPTYQTAAVAGYLSMLGSEFKGLYNASGRAYPDIAAQGQRYTVIYNGTLRLVDGTSASAPCSAGVLALVDDALLAAGKKPLGFLNPWLYKVGYQSFTDVTSGSAIGCDGPGFPATKGWDPVSGFGTPNFKEIKAATC